LAPRNLDGEVEEEANRLLANLAHHVLEESEALTPVLHERVALRHRAQTDSVFQVVHLVEVVTPAAVDDAQHHTTLKLTHRGSAELLLTARVRVTGIREHLLQQEVARHATSRTGLREQLIDRDRDGVDRAKLGPER